MGTYGDFWFVIRRTDTVDREDRLPYPGLVLAEVFLDRQFVDQNVAAGRWLAATTDEEQAYGLVQLYSLSEGLPWVDLTPEP